MQDLCLALCTSFLFSACAEEKSPGSMARKSMNSVNQVDTIILGMGCFWGAEKRMSAIPSVIDVEIGY